jgi:hypothetical protein
MYPSVPISITFSLLIRKLECRERLERSGVAKYKRFPQNSFREMRAVPTRRQFHIAEDVSGGVWASFRISSRRIQAVYSLLRSL